MQARTYVADQILTKYSISDYLEKLGVKSETGIKGRVLFCCPLHKEDTPSFIVYPQSERDPYESFYCYGCKKGGNLISLKCAMEGIGYKRAVETLAEGIDVRLDDQAAYAVEQISRVRGAEDEDVIDDCMLLISRSVYNHMKVTNRHPDEFTGCEKILKLADEYAERRDRGERDGAVCSLDAVLLTRLKKYEKELDRQNAEAARVYASI